MSKTPSDTQKFLLVTATSFLTIAALANIIGNTLPVLYQFERYFFCCALFGLGLGFFKEDRLSEVRDQTDQTERIDRTDQADRANSSVDDKLDAEWAIWLAAASAVLFLFTCGSNPGGLAGVMGLALLDQSHDIFDFTGLKHGLFTDLLTVVLSSFLLLASVQIFVGPGKQLKHLINNGTVKRPMLLFGAGGASAWALLALIDKLGLPPAILFVFTFLGYFFQCRKQKLCAMLGLFTVMASFYAGTADLPQTKKWPDQYKAMAGNFFAEGSRIDTEPLLKDDKLFGLCLYSDRQLSQVLTLPELCADDVLFIQKHFDLPPFPVDFRQLPYLVRPSMQGKNALVLGSAIGSEVAACLGQHPARVTAVESSAWLTATSVQQTFSPYKNPAVTLVTADPRLYLAQSKDKYDLIVYTDHAASNRPSPFLPFNHNDFLFTQESFAEARNHLTPDGQILIASQPADEVLRLRLVATLLAANTKIDASLTTPFANYLMAASNEDSFAASNTLVPDLRKKLGGKIVNHEQWITAGAAGIVPFSDNSPYEGAAAPMLPLADTFFSIMTLLAILISMRLATPKTMLQNITGQRCKIILLGTIYMALVCKALSVAAFHLGLTPPVIYGSIIYSWIVFCAAAVSDGSGKRLPGWLLWTAFAFSLSFDFSFNFESAFAAATGSMQILATAIVPWLSPFFAATVLAREFAGNEKPADTWGLFLLGLAIGCLFAMSALFNGVASLDLLAAFLACLSGLLTWLPGRQQRGIINAT